MRLLRDHARIETMLFEGALLPIEGRFYPDRTQAGMRAKAKSHIHP